MDLAFAEQWRWVAGASLQFHAWEGEDLVLVFQAASGDTHLLDALSAEVLQRLRDGPLCPEVLWLQVRDHTGSSPDDFPPERLQTILSSLEQLELIERVSA